MNSCELESREHVAKFIVYSDTHFLSHLTIFENAIIYKSNSCGYAKLLRNARDSDKYLPNSKIPQKLLPIHI